MDPRARLVRALPRLLLVDVKPEGDSLHRTRGLRDVILVGFSSGGGEVARYVGRSGNGRVAKVALISAAPPLILKTDVKLGGLPIKVFDGLSAASIAGLLNVDYLHSTPIHFNILSNDTIL